VVSTAVSDALSIAKSRTEKLTEIGGFQFNVESCKQLQIWAEEIIVKGQTGAKLEDLVQLLDEISNFEETLVHGKLTDVRFPVKANWTKNRLDLSHTPGLTKLECCKNRLAKLDLSHTPGLTELECSENDFTELDLSHTPGLTKLQCWDNPLTELDLSHTPGLTVLGCGNNQLAELDLSHTPGLTKLQCWDNPLTELDLSHTPGLRILWCAGNQLEELDIRNNPTLKICEVGDGVKIIKHDWRLRDE
jgi:hypothetical protein